MSCSVVMETIVKFVSPTKVAVQTSQGDRFTLGLSNAVPLVLQQQDAAVIAQLFEKYYKGDPAVIMGPIFRELLIRGGWSQINWYGPDRNAERERIGAQIRSLREQRKMDAKDLAILADLDASNLSRIEKGKYSAGLDILCKIAAALNCTIEFVPDSNTVYSLPQPVLEYEHQDILITAKRSTFRLEECLQKYGEYHWQQTRFNVHPEDTVYIYVSEDRAIKYKMTVVEANKSYDRWMGREEEFWVDHSRIDVDESTTKYALLRLEAVSKSGKLTKENLMEHGFLRAPQGVKHLEGDLLKYIKRKF